MWKVQNKVNTCIRSINIVKQLNGHLVFSDAQKIPSSNTTKSPLYWPWCVCLCLCARVCVCVLAVVGRKGERRSLAFTQSHQNYLQEVFCFPILASTSAQRVECKGRYQGWRTGWSALFCTKHSLGTQSFMATHIPQPASKKDCLVKTQV